MPRKKSISGRARGKSIENKMYILSERVNRRIRALEKSGEFGKYKSRELLEYASRTPYINIKKARGSKRRRLVISKIKKTIGQQRETIKKLSSILKSKVFSPIGIKKVREETRDTLKQTLREKSVGEISESDIDKFYDIAKYSAEAEQESILRQVNPSEFFALVDVAKERSMSANQWANMLGDYVNINNDYMRKEAEELYYKYVA